MKTKELQGLLGPCEDNSHFLETNDVITLGKEKSFPVFSVFLPTHREGKDLKWTIFRKGVSHFNHWFGKSLRDPLGQAHSLPYNKERKHPLSSANSLSLVGGESESGVAQFCPTLCDPMDCSPPGSSVHGISQARILVWVAMISSRGSSWPWDWTHVSCVPCIDRQILYHFATWEAPTHLSFEVSSWEKEIP